MRNSFLCELFVNDAANNAGKKGNSMHISEDGTRLFSYGTCIAQHTADGSIIVNESKYSVTTSKHQCYLTWALRDAKTIPTTKRVPTWTSYLNNYVD